jgi:phosphoribosylanthranilate isomerase
MSVKVKICGIACVEDARAAVAAGADFLGLNFHPPSPRHLDIDAATAIAAAVGGVPLVGVFVDAPRDTVERIAAAVGLAALQFHGDEEPDYCRDWPWRTIKALRVRAGADVTPLAARYDTDYLLIDSHVPGLQGGTGVPLALEALGALPADRLFVAGGLTPETVADAVRRFRPFAVDVASGVEERPGRKDHAKLEALIRRAKAA